MELSPQDAVAALRSFPRRFAAALDVTDGEERGFDAAVAETDTAGRTLAVLADAVARTLGEGRPTLHPAVGDASARVFPDVDVSAEAALDLLTLEAQSLADRAEHVGAADWGRAAVVPGADDTTAIDLLREAVKVVAAHLHRAERARGRG